MFSETFASTPEPALDAPAFHGMGHNSQARAADVERTADELIRERYLRRWLNPGLPYVVRALNEAALAEDVSDPEFRHLYILTRNGGANADDIRISNADLAALRRIDVRSVRRISEGLETKGRLVRDRTERDGRQWVNTFRVVARTPVLEILHKLDRGGTPGVLPEDVREDIQSPPSPDLGRTPGVRPTFVGRTSSDALGGLPESPSIGKNLEKEVGDLDPHRVPKNPAGGDLFAALPPRDREKLVEVNGSAIRAPGIVIPFSLINENAIEFKIDPDRARRIAKATVEGWVANGIVPGNPPAMMTAALKQYKPASRAPKVPKPEYTEEFGFFWELYPRKEGKGEAFKSWEKLTIDQKRRAYAALKKQILYLKSRAAEKGNLCPHAATWLNQSRFDDDPKTARTTI